MSKVVKDLKPKRKNTKKVEDKTTPGFLGGSIYRIQTKFPPHQAKTILDRYLKNRKSERKDK